MLKTLLLLTGITIFSAGFTQTFEAVKLIEAKLKPGVSQAAITSYQFPEATKQLQLKALTKLKGDPRWSDKYIVRLVERGATDLPYMEAYGLTRIEFDSLMAGFRRGQQPVYSDTLKFGATKTNGIITFKSEKQLKVFEHLFIDTRKREINFDNYLITKEIEIKGKFYAPTLYGFEAHSSVSNGRQKRLAKITSAGLTVGHNKGSDRLSLCLILTTPGEKGLADFEFMNITIF